MNNELKACKTENSPEFVKLLDAFKKQLTYMEENSGVIYEKVNTLKDMREAEKQSIPEELKPCGGVLDELWECVSRMEKHNEILNESRLGLLKLIG